MSLPICATCGTQYAEHRADCPICLDQRQWVPLDGQRWTDLATVRAEHQPVIRPDAGVLGIGADPKFAIGQRALLVPTEAGNILWDCTAYLDDEVVRAIDERGGLAGIAISHPHYYTTMVEWAHTFDVPIHLHAADREWVGRPDPAIEFWDGTTKELAPGVTLINLGVHFTGGTVLHEATGRGALYSGDIVQVIPDRTHVAFMYSYPNLIPERPSVVRRAAEILRRYPFDALYGAWWDAVIPTGAQDVVQRSAQRYLAFVHDEVGEVTAETSPTAAD